nr:DMT family transporter [Actinomyces wuliandei]
MANGALHINHLIGNVLALATAFFYAAFLLVTKSLRERHSALKVMTILGVWCGVGCLFVSAIARENATPETLRGWSILLGLAVSSQLLGQTLMAHCVKYISIQLASLFILLQPVAAALYSYILFDEILTATQVLGVCALLAAIYRSREIMES